MRDVAKRAGVSVATVSRVLNENGFIVRSHTRNRVLEAIDALHYVKNDLARGLHKENTFTVGVIVPDAANPYYPEIIRGVEAVAYENKYAVIFCNTDHRNDKFRYYVDVLMQKRVDGLVGVGGDFDYGEARDQVSRMGSGLVLIGRHDDLAVPTVETPDVGGGVMAGEHLLGLGHRRIAFISGNPRSVASLDRIQGFRESCAAHDVAIDDSLILAGDYQEGSGYTLGQQLLTRFDPPTAIVCANDRMALGVMAAARDLGVDIPQDLSVLGFDNITASLYVRPSITTVESPGHRAGEEAMRIMLKILRGEQPPRRTILSTQLIVRQSTSLAPGVGL